ncbi:SMI1/KNR4 family protein [Pseudomonas iridis]|uniref:SMI1/KNR4 family protein n=1 Tax=Pseudomonas iridis TaxID=2710587 RepID=UPI0037F40F4D
MSKNTIYQVQKLLYANFPESYLDLVIHSDSASPKTSEFSYGDEKTCISEFFQFSADVTPYTILWNLEAGSRPGLPKGMVPIARDAGGKLVYLNLNTHSIAIEIFDPASSKTHVTASNFDEFIGLWSEYINFPLQLRHFLSSRS